MQAVMTRQDLQGALETAKNRIVERLASRTDVQGACDNARDRILTSMNTIFQQHQQFLRQSIVLSDTAARRTASAEARVISLEQEMKSLKQILFTLVEEQRRLTTVITAMPELLAPPIRAQRETHQEARMANRQPYYGTA